MNTTKTPVFSKLETLNFFTQYCMKKWRRKMEKNWGAECGGLAQLRHFLQSKNTIAPDSHTLSKRRISPVVSTPGSTPCAKNSRTSRE